MQRTVTQPVLAEGGNAWNSRGVTSRSHAAQSAT
jgi:hypothetical protein